jgi:glycosyltransferase involved in cell wall biosynthesis
MSRWPDRSKLQRPRVGYILKMFPRLSETFILNEILELEQQGLALRIFSLKRPVDAVLHHQAQSVRSPISYLPQGPAQAPWRIAQAHVHVWSKYPRHWRHTLANVVRRGRATGDRGAWHSFCQACCIVREMRGIQHLHAHYANLPAKIALLIHRLTGTSYSVTTHAKDIFQNDPLASPKLLERLCRAQFVVANSRFSAEHIRSHLDGEATLEVVYNGLDLRSFPRRTTQPAEPVILSVGRLVEKKGFPDLVAACELLKQRGVNFRCELVGTGQLSAVLKDQIRIRGLGERIKMVGPLPQAELRGHYERAMVFALPCIQAADGDRDILPNVLKEALAVGLPVITTRLDGVEELIEHDRNGWLVAPGDVPALADALERLLQDPRLRARLAVEGRTVVEQRFDRRANFARLKELLLHSCDQSLPWPVADPDRDCCFYDANCLR